MSGYTTVTKPREYFRDRDFELQNSAGAVSAHDHSLYVWRRPAVRRLALARPLYGVLQKARKAGKPDVINTLDYLALLAVLPRSLRSVRND